MGSESEAQWVGHWIVGPSPGPRPLALAMALLLGTPAGPPAPCSSPLLESAAWLGTAVVEGQDLEARVWRPMAPWHPGFVSGHQSRNGCRIGTPAVRMAATAVDLVGHEWIRTRLPARSLHQLLVRRGSYLDQGLREESRRRGVAPPRARCVSLARRAGAAGRPALADRDRDCCATVGSLRRSSLTQLSELGLVHARARHL